MIDLLFKIFKTPSNIEKVKLSNEPELISVGQELEKSIKRLFKGSLAIRVATGGSTNACEQELVALGNSFYDVERFGVHFVASPRHADMLIVTGPVSRNMKKALIDTYEAMPDPKIVVALGDDAINGGIFKGSYAVLDGAKNVIPVNYEIPGDPPSPMTILQSLLAILDDISLKRQAK